jgi:predicted kinase
MPIVTAVAQLILINGLPGSGKSTVARSVAAERPLSLVLDVDVVRGLLSGWIDTPTTAGLLARELALAMCATHLGAGYDVLVPQFLGRPEFVVSLERSARDAGVPFVEIALLLPPERAAERVAERVAERSAASARPEHADAGALLEREGGASALAEMEHRLITVLDDRPATHRVDADRELEAVRQAVRGYIDPG